MAGIRSSAVLAAVMVCIFGTVGCTGRDDIDLFDSVKKKSLKYEALRHSEKVIFHQGQDNETIIFITYLNKRSNKQGEYFTISVSPPENVSVSNFRMQEQEALSIHRISHDKLPSSIVASTPPWFESYIVIFPYINLDKFDVTVNDKTGESRLLHFYKAPRYIANKTAFQIM